MAGPLGFELMRALQHKFILIYFRDFRVISRPIIHLGEPIDINLISLMDMLSAYFRMHNCDTKTQLLLAKPYRSKWEGRTLTLPLIFLTLKCEGRAVQKGGSDFPNPPANRTLVVGPSAWNDLPVELRSLLMTRPSKFYIYFKPIFDRDWAGSASE